jgi:hypothetical protein
MHIKLDIYIFISWNIVRVNDFFTQIDLQLF